MRKRVKEALAIATYRTQTSYRVVKGLLCDDAPRFTGLTDEVALCGIHDYRHYKKLMPRKRAAIKLSGGMSVPLLL